MVQRVGDGCDGEAEKEVHNEVELIRMPYRAKDSTLCTVSGRMG